jgi:hypothetical protein
MLLGLCAATGAAALSAPEAEPWWSFQPLKRPPTPRVRDASWLRTPIDAFVLHKLEARALSPSPEADRRTLIRRLTFDLHGLPPSPDEVEAFVNDTAPDAYERLVDRLLSSSHYGERWARHWLDVAHYGDTHGYDKDKRRDHAWPYRDYVIRAFNADKPYDCFVREQLAGDKLLPDDPDGVIATGFIAAGPWDFVGHVELREGTVDKEKTRLIDRDDMVANAMSTFASLTVHCARCHDHKFDPIPQRDYYRLQAVFAGVERGDRARADLEQDRRRQRLLDRRKSLEATVAHWLAEARKRAGAEFEQAEKTLDERKAELARLPAPGKAGASPSNGYHSAIMPGAGWEKWVQVDLGQSLPIEAVRLHPARPTDFPDSPGFGFPLRYRVELADEPTFAKPVRVVDQSEMDVNNPGDTVVEVAARKQSGRYVRVTASRLWKRTNDYVFALAELQVIVDGKNAAQGKEVTARDSIEAGRWSTRYLVDGYSSRAPLTASADSAQKERTRLTALVREAESRRQAVLAGALSADERKAHAEAAQGIAALDQELQSLPLAPQVYAAVPRAPRPVHVLKRGDVEQARERVWPGAIAAVRALPADFGLADKPDEAAGRVALASWLTHPDNPLTWRSIVNRVWHYHFGKGLVDTPNDFGRMGGQPSHPELLDWLATEFRDGGQSLKRLHKLILMSAAYRQSSVNNPTAAKVDNDNRLLWRMNRTRLDAESIRDSVLAVSGKLDAQMGGPGFEVFRFRDDHSPEYDHSALEKIHDPRTFRRTIYRFAVRSVPNPLLECLDCADPNQNVPVRGTTLTALQALALLNDPFMIRQAEHLAERLRRESTDPGAQVAAAYRLLFSRSPTADEQLGVVNYAAKHGLVAACRLLFNANEFVFVD